MVVNPGHELPEEALEWRWWTGDLAVLWSTDSLTTRHTSILSMSFRLVFKQWTLVSW